MILLPMHRRRRAGPSAARHLERAAFTLIEITLAIAILLMVLSVVYSTWMIILRSKKAADKAAINAQRSRITVQALEEALSGIQVFSQNEPYYSFIADTSGQYALLSVASRLPASFPGSGLFGDQALRRVTFNVETGTNGEEQLVLRQYPLLLATNAVEEAYPIVLASQVTDFLLEFWDSRRGEWVPEWLYTNQLPAVVRFLIGVGQRANDASMPQAVQVRTVALSATPVPFELEGRPVGRLPQPPQGTNQPPPGPGNPGPGNPNPP